MQLVRILGGLLAIWLVGLGLTLCVSQRAGAQWYVRATQRLLRRLVRFLGRLLGWFMRVALVHVGRVAATAVSGAHNFLVGRWPNGTLVVYGAVVIVVILSFVIRFR